MGQLIDELLDFHRIGRKPLDQQVTDLNELVQRSRNLGRGNCHRQIEWHISELPSANADPVLLQQVYTNLLGNAIKYTSKRPLAHIEIGSFEQAEETIYFVQDNGAGFEMQFSEKLFGVFSACTAKMNSRARASGWPSSSASSTVTAGAFGPQPQWNKALPFLYPGQP
ncbi:MAG: ATP-binding protein [Desulfobacterales bacterium]|nr:ATP-binding protein [Desulfobacterales bacterium]